MGMAGSLKCRSLVAVPAFIGGCALAPLAQAQDDYVGLEEVLAGAESSFAVPIEDLYVRRHDSEARELLSGLSVAPSLYLPFSARGVGSQSNGVSAATSPAARLNLRYRPLGHWFANVTLHKYLDESERKPWDPDFTYSFGYDDWHPYTFSLVYSNYANNRLDPKEGDPITRLSYGTVSAGYKAPAPRAIARKLLIDPSLSVDCRMDLHVTPRFDRNDGKVGKWKRAASLGCRYPFTSRLYVDFTGYAWEHGQQPWDPDFTYGFGLFDYRSNRFSLQYSNYSGNRFPWRRAAKDTGRFKNGGVLVSWSHDF
jgi:hypothetical protein